MITLMLELRFQGMLVVIKLLIFWRWFWSWWINMNGSDSSSLNQNLQIVTLGETPQTFPHVIFSQ
jgi:hypothetical protein